MTQLGEASATFSPAFGRCLGAQRQSLRFVLSRHVLVLLREHATLAHFQLCRMLSAAKPKNVRSMPIQIVLKHASSPHACNPGCCSHTQEPPNSACSSHACSPPANPCMVTTHNQCKKKGRINPQVGADGSSRTAAAAHQSMFCFWVLQDQDPHSAGSELAEAHLDAGWNCRSDM